MTPEQRRRLELLGMSTDDLFDSYIAKLRLEHQGRVL
jgi:hypothetical protein